LTAKAGFDGAVIAAELTTTTEPVGFTLVSDKTELAADGYDVAHLVVQLVDKAGRPVKTENRKVTFKLTGDARMLGVDTGGRNNVQDFQSDHIVTDQGRCLLIVQSNRKPGAVSITAQVSNMEAQTVSLSLQ